MRNVLQYFVFFAVACAVSFAVPSNIANASTSAVMSQAILPVRFVYLEKDGNIDRIWSNVTEKDQAYVLKFVRPDGKEEIDGDSNLISLFVKKYQNPTDNNNSVEVRFLHNKDGLEEVRTYS